MAKWAIQMRKMSGEAGTYVIEETGLCLATDVAGIEAGCCRRYKMVPIPAAAGAILKILDGTSPILAAITLTTTGAVYGCAKVYAEVNPFAPPQDGGLLRGKAVLQYTIRWQQVGGVS